MNKLFKFANLLPDIGAIASFIIVILAMIMAFVYGTGVYIYEPNKFIALLEVFIMTSLLIVFINKFTIKVKNIHLEVKE